MYKTGLAPLRVRVQVECTLFEEDYKLKKQRLHAILNPRAEIARSVEGAGMLIAKIINTGVRYINTCKDRHPVDF
jgi:hypothetical protein